MELISHAQILVLATNNKTTLPNVPEQRVSILITGFHRALLQSINFISRLNVLNYTNLRG